MKILEIKKSKLYPKIIQDMDSRRRTNLRLIVMSCEVSKNDSNLERILTPTVAKRIIQKVKIKCSRMKIVHIKKACTRNKKHWNNKDTEF